MSENTTPEVIEGEGVSEETPKVKLIDRIGRKGKIALGAVGAMAITAIAGSFVKNEIYGSVTDAFGDVLEEWTQDTSPSKTRKKTKTRRTLKKSNL